MAARTGPTEHLLHDFVQAGPWLEPERVVATVQHFLNTLKTKGIDVYLPCGTTDGGPAVQDCWNAYHLGVLNRSLERVHLELREYSPGEMCINMRFTWRTTPNCVADRSLIDAAFIFYWLVQHHRCVRSVWLGRSALLCERMPTLVSNALRSGLFKELGICPPALHNNSQNVILSGIQHPASRTKLYLGENVFQDGCSTAYIVAVLDAGRLCSLVLERYPKGKKDARRLFRALSNCSSLTSLRRGSGARRIPGAVALLSCGLRCLRLNGVTGLLVAEVLTWVSDNDTLEELYLVEGCHVDDPVPPEFVELLVLNRRLETLRMLNLGMHDSCAVAFAEVLRNNNPTLEDAELSGCYIGNVGATALAGALEVNASLKALYLEDNVMTELAVPAFLRALLKNERVELVCLSSVDMPEHWIPDVEINDPDKVFGRLQVGWNSWGVDETERYVSNGVGAAGEPVKKALRLLWERWVPIQHFESC